MTLQPNFLPVGSVFQRNGIPCTVQIASNDSISTNLSSGLLKEFSGIQLTPEILTEWCGFDEKDKFNFLGSFGIGTNSKGVYCLLYSNEFCVTLFENITFEYLHELQMAYLVHMKQVLTVRIK